MIQILNGDVEVTGEQLRAAMGQIQTVFQKHGMKQDAPLLNGVVLGDAISKNSGDNVILNRKLSVLNVEIDELKENVRNLEGKIGAESNRFPALNDLLQRLDFHDKKIVEMNEVVKDISENNFVERRIEDLEYKRLDDVRWMEDKYKVLNGKVEDLDGRLDEALDEIGAVFEENELKTSKLLERSPAGISPERMMGFQEAINEELRYIRSNIYDTKTDMRKLERTVGVLQDERSLDNERLYVLEEQDEYVTREEFESSEQEIEEKIRKLKTETRNDVDDIREKLKLAAQKQAGMVPVVVNTKTSAKTPRDNYSTKEMRDLEDGLRMAMARIQSMPLDVPKPRGTEDNLIGNKNLQEIDELRQDINRLRLQLEEKPKLPLTEAKPTIITEKFNSGTQVTMPNKIPEKFNSGTQTPPLAVVTKDDEVNKLQKDVNDLNKTVDKEFRKNETSFKKVAETIQVVKTKLTAEINEEREKRKSLAMSVKNQIRGINEAIADVMNK